MARKKWVPQTSVTPELIKSREKRKWQIAFRRYVIERKPSVPYAPYFGLDIENLRKWLEIQFPEDLGWDDFGRKWQFDHIIPVAYFDFSQEEELKLCWNFINIRVKSIGHPHQGGWLEALQARTYFNDLYAATRYPPCLSLLQKLRSLEQQDPADSTKQQAFIMAHQPYLSMIANYSAFEFDLLNSGRSVDEVNKEVDFLKKF